MTTVLRKSGLAAAVLTCLLYAGVALSQPSVHKATGGGTVEFGGAKNTVAFTAQIDAAGSVKGQAEFQLRNVDLRLHVDVDCLSVSGNRAWIAGVITESSDPTRVGTRVLWEVVDNGEGSAAPPDQVSMPVQFTAASCTTHPALALVDWTNGNVQVQ